jgi:hypothetical protein
MNIGQKKGATTMNKQRIENRSNNIMLKMNIGQRRGAIAVNGQRIEKKSSNI